MAHSINRLTPWCRRERKREQPRGTNQKTKSQKNETVGKKQFHLVSDGIRRAIHVQPRITKAVFEEKMYM